MQDLANYCCAAKTPSSSSSLDRLGNKPTSATTVEGRNYARHSHHWKARRLIIDALHGKCPDRAPREEQVDTDALDRRAFNLIKCNTYPKIWVTQAGLPTVVWGQCRDRMCPRCSFYRAKRVSKQISEKLVGCDSLRFITLTLAADQKPLGERLNRLYDAFRRLRRRDDWKERVLGGVATLEVTLNKETGNWNVHLHLVADGLFFDQAMLSAMWLDVTGDSRIVFIKAVYDRSGCGDYIAKYLVKPQISTGPHLGPIREYAIALSGRRLVMTWGSLHGKNVDKAPKPERDAQSREAGDCNMIIHRASIGNPWSSRVIAIAQELGPTFAGAFGEYPVDDWDPETPPSAGVYEAFLDALHHEKLWREGKPTPTDLRPPGHDNP